MKIGFIGECMAELSQAGDGLLRQAFAGDTYNSAVYLKRTFSQCDVQFISGLGTDSISQAMLDSATAEQVGTELIGRTDKLTIGLYQIHTDPQGERSFTYWRSNSAARQTLSLMNKDAKHALCSMDMVMFSGITLAILPPPEREALWALLDNLKQANVKLVFDINYRPALWTNRTEAQQSVKRGIEYADILLPGVEDFSQLFELTKLPDIMAFCQAGGATEIVLKNGAQEVHLYGDDSARTVTIEPVKKVVDTTSAGDAFNGVYLGARLSGFTMEQATQQAAACAGFVIQHRGAIVDASQYQTFVAQLRQA